MYFHLNFFLVHFTLIIGTHARVVTITSQCMYLTKCRARHLSSTKISLLFFQPSEANCGWTAMSQDKKYTSFLPNERREVVSFYQIATNIEASLWRIISSYPSPVPQITHPCLSLFFPLGNGDADRQETQVPPPLKSAPPCWGALR